MLLLNEHFSLTSSSKCSEEIVFSNTLIASSLFSNDNNSLIVLIATTVDISLIPLPLFSITTERDSNSFLLTKALDVNSLTSSIVEFVPISSNTATESGLGLIVNDSIMLLTFDKVFIVFKHITIHLFSSYATITISASRASKACWNIGFTSE